MKRTLTVCHAAVNSRVCFALSGINSAHMAHSASALPGAPVLAGGTVVLEATAVWGARAVRHNPVFVAGTAVFGMPPVWGTTAVWGTAAAQRRRRGAITTVYGNGTSVPTPEAVNPALRDTSQPTGQSTNIIINGEN